MTHCTHRDHYSYYKWSGEYRHIAEVRGHFVMKFHMSSALFASTNYIQIPPLYQQPTYMCWEVCIDREVYRACSIHVLHRGLSLTRQQLPDLRPIKDSCLYLLPTPQTCQPRQAHSGIEWLLHKEHLQVCMSIDFRDLLHQNSITHVKHHEFPQQTAEDTPTLKWPSHWDGSTCEAYRHTCQCLQIITCCPRTQQDCHPLLPSAGELPNIGTAGLKTHFTSRGYQLPLHPRNGLGQ